MTTSVSELWPAISNLSYADKNQLIQLVLTEIVQENEEEEERSDTRPNTSFDPRRFFGISHQPKQVIDEYLESSREGWI